MTSWFIDTNDPPAHRGLTLAGSARDGAQGDWRAFDSGGTGTRPGQTWYGGFPEPEDDAPKEPMAARVMAAIRKRLYQKLPADWLIPRLGGHSTEIVISRYGSIEVRVTPAATVAQTSVKGELDRARQTGLRRLARLASGNYRLSLFCRTERPVVQQSHGPGRWLVRVGLPTQITADPPVTQGKVKVARLPEEILAVVRIAGRPTQCAIARGTDYLLASLATTEWQAEGPAMIRLYAPPLRLPYASSFEIACPVSNQGGQA